jgi:hypothetical protein
MCTCRDLDISIIERFNFQNPLILVKQRNSCPTGYESSEYKSRGAELFYKIVEENNSTYLEIYKKVEGEFILSSRCLTSNVTIGGKRPQNLKESLEKVLFICDRVSANLVSPPPPPPPPPSSDNRDCPPCPECPQCPPNDNPPVEVLPDRDPLIFLDGRLNCSHKQYDIYISYVTEVPENERNGTLEKPFKSVKEAISKMNNVKRDYLNGFITYVRFRFLSFKTRGIVGIHSKTVASNPSEYLGDNPNVPSEGILTIPFWICYIEFHGEAFENRCYLATMRVRRFVFETKYPISISFYYMKVILDYKFESGEDDIIFNLKGLQELSGIKGMPYSFYVMNSVFIQPKLRGSNSPGYAYVFSANAKFVLFIIDRVFFEFRGAVLKILGQNGVDRQGYPCNRSLYGSRFLSVSDCCITASSIQIWYWPGNSDVNSNCNVDFSYLYHYAPESYIVNPNNSISYPFDYRHLVEVYQNVSNPEFVNCGFGGFLTDYGPYDVNLDVPQLFNEFKLQGCNTVTDHMYAYDFSQYGFHKYIQNDLSNYYTGFLKKINIYGLKSIPTRLRKYVLLNNSSNLQLNINTDNQVIIQ